MLELPTLTSPYVYPFNLDRVIDGDTIDVFVDLGFRVVIKVRLRLKGVDTPEIYGVKEDSDEYMEGIEAMDIVHMWFEETKDPYYVQSYKTGKYGRWEAIIFTETSCLNNHLIEEGYGL